MKEPKRFNPRMSSVQQPTASKTAARWESRAAESRLHARQAVVEQNLVKRDVAASSRESTLAYREQNVLMREQAASARELDISTMESGNRWRLERDAGGDERDIALEQHVIRLRQANEHLVIAALRAETITDQIQQANARMGYIAHHDFLTDLPNRLALMERLEQAIALARRHHCLAAVLFIDLDRFKAINDSLGHAIGDRLLQCVAARLLESVRATDTVSRLGGDEFVALLSEVTDAESVAGFAQKVCRALTAPYEIDGQRLHVGATIGISMFPENGEDADSLIHNADLAMYAAKKQGGNAFFFYQRGLNDIAIKRQSIEGELRLALMHGQFELFYQPQQHLKSGRVTSVEALVRWHHPERGLQPPAEFIGIAEECGVIIGIGQWVLRESCRQMQAWLDEGLAIDTMSVNISAIEFGQTGFYASLVGILGETGLAPAHLELELTESVLMRDPHAATRLLHQVRALGIRIAVDDFGTGYSSLSYLKQFPIDTIKIDQSFISGAELDHAGGVIVRSVILLGENLQCQVVAEGIETPEQAHFLIASGCPVGQGYFFSRPLQAGECAARLRALL